MCVYTIDSCMCVAHCIIRVVEELFYDIFPGFLQPYLERMWDLAEYFVAQLISETSMVSLAHYPTHRVLHKSTHYIIVYTCAYIL